MPPTAQMLLAMLLAATCYALHQPPDQVEDWSLNDPILIDDPADAWEFMGRGENLTRSCTKKLLPSFLYIGGGHSGSTTFANDLVMHPKLSYGRMKEHRCLTSVHEKTCDYTVGGIEQYEDQFEVGCEVEQTFDATPETLFCGNYRWPKRNMGLLFGLRGKQAVESVRYLLGPNLKFIIMIRDPVDWLNSRFGNDAILDEDRWWYTCHAETLKPWLQTFPRENFLFVKSEDYFADRMGVLNQTFNFLGVDPVFAPFTLLAPSGRRRVRTTVSAAQRRAFHKNKDNIKCKNQLEKMTSLKFDWQYEDAVPGM